MIDLETMAVTPDAAILSIGACAFDLTQRNEAKEIVDRFYVAVSLESNEAANRRFQAGTIAWWLKQSKEAQASLFEEPIRNLRTACTELRMWAQNLTPAVNWIWANDPDFDIVILRNAFQQVDQLWPWHFALNRSCRTIKHLAWPDDDCPNFRAGTVHHRADDDAIAQARMVQHAFHRLVMANPSL